MHGGTNPGAPVKTGLYSKVLKRSLRVKYQEFLADTGYTSLVSELALLRALTAEYAGRFVEGVALPGEDIERLASIIDKAGRLLERMNRIDARTALTARELDLLSVVIIRELTADLGPDGAQAFWSRVTSSMFGFAELPAPQDVIEGASHVYGPV